MTKQIAVVTGASSGIGRATAKELARRGFRVVLCARSRDKLEQLAKEIADGGGEARVEAVDAADGDAVAAMATRVTTEWGHPHVVINSAGAGRWLFVEETTPAEAQAMIGAPYLAALHATHAFMPAMLAARRGVVIHVQSPAGYMPWRGATAYVAARFALRGLHEALCQDLAGTGVASCEVVFGEVTSSYFEVNGGSYERLPRIARMVPAMSPEQCAKVVATVVARPRRRVVAPAMLTLFMWMNAVAPWAVRGLLSATGFKRQATPPARAD